MIKGHKIEKKIDLDYFLELINNIKEENIITTKHSFFRLKESQRKIYSEQIIKDYILGGKPILIGIQFNGNYSVFYSHKGLFLKLILDIKTQNINIVTFYIVDKLPKV